MAIHIVTNLDNGYYGFHVATASFQTAPTGKEQISKFTLVRETDEYEYKEIVAPPQMVKRFSPGKKVSYAGQVYGILIEPMLEHHPEIDTMTMITIIRFKAVRLEL